MSTSDTAEYFVTDSMGKQRDTIKIYGKRFKLIRPGIGAILALLCSSISGYYTFQYFYGYSGGGLSEGIGLGKVILTLLVAATILVIVFYLICARPLTKEELSTMQKKQKTD